MSKKFEKLLKKLDKSCGELYNALGDLSVKCIDDSAEVEKEFEKMLNKCNGDLDKLSTYLLDLGIIHRIETVNQFEFFCFDLGLMVRFDTETGNIRCMSFLDTLLGVEILDMTMFEFLFGSEEETSGIIH